MVIHTKKSFIHWNYFLALQNDLAEVSRYIEFDKPNYKTYSIELSHLLLASASEVDVVAKGICKYLEPSSSPKNINEYRGIITKKLPDFSKEHVYVPRFNINFRPWINWTKKNKTNPLWWKAYNDVKHNRSEQFANANLKHVLNSMGGLLVSVFYFYKLQFIEEGRVIKANDDVFIILDSDGGFMQLQDAYYPQTILWG